MKGLAMMLRALGIEIPAEQIPVITDVLVNLPAHVQDVGKFLQGKIASFDARLLAIENRLTAIEEKIDVSTGNGRGASTDSGNTATDASYGIPASDAIRD